MLQIATGKLFSLPVGRENLLRGMLYTNASLEREIVVETAAGKLVPSSRSSIQPTVVVYELQERIEAEENGPGVLVSCGAEPYLSDFAVVASFALNCVCSPDIDLARRLTSGKKGLATRASPHQFVSRFFEPELWCKPEEVAFLQEFVGQLIGLPRQTYLGVMRAIRTYINGMHRIADDLELAYTLLVASVESLAQDFDGHESDWASYDQRKRQAVDQALTGADEAVGQRVRDALIKVEHTALARRFREFAIAYTPPEYFRDVTLVPGQALPSTDMAEALTMAYQARSKYVHQLMRLPSVVVLGHGYAETVLHERKAYLTLQGLSRLMRNVIIKFVASQPSLDREPYPRYSLERTNIIQLRMAPQYWVGNAEGDLLSAGRSKLEGFLEQLVPCQLGEEGAVLTDLRPVLSAVAHVVLGAKRDPRLPYLALYTLFNMVVPVEQGAPVSEGMEKLINQDLSQPSPEALLVHTVAGKVPGWTLEVHDQTIKTYLKRRGSPSGIRFPRFYEAAVSLDLAERYRMADDMVNCRRLVALAVGSHPGHQRLLELEAGIDPGTPIHGVDVLLPRSDPGTDD